MELSVILALYGYGVEELAIMLKECKEKLVELMALRERKSELSTEYFETIKEEYLITVKEFNELSEAFNLASEDQSFFKYTLEDLKFMEKNCVSGLEELRLLSQQQDRELTTEELAIVMEEYDSLVEKLQFVKQEMKLGHYQLDCKELKLAQEKFEKANLEIQQSNEKQLNISDVQKEIKNKENP